MDWLDRATRAVEAAIVWGNLGVLGAFGGIANFYYLNATKERAFVWGVLAANVVVAFFIGQVLGGFIGSDNQFRDGLVMLFGFFSFPVVHLLESRIVALVDKLLPFGGR